VFRHEIGAGGLVSVGATLHERRFTPSDVRPSDYPHLLQDFHYTFD
jgi:hypothetical protein